MLAKIRAGVKNTTRKFGFDIVHSSSSVHFFHSNYYLRYNARRLEHLASLRIPIQGMSVLEVGAGIGDMSDYFIDRGCSVTITEVRAENLAYLKNRFPAGRVQFLDMEAPLAVEGAPFDVVFSYGLLYHLSSPKQALEYFSRNATQFLLLETCVSFGEDEEINLTGELQAVPTQAFSGTGCRPTRAWIFKQLAQLFEYVYLPTTQPCHPEFPLDWTAPAQHKADLQRAIFIASRQPLDNDRLVPYLIPRQTRHE